MSRACQRAFVRGEPWWPCPRSPADISPLGADMSHLARILSIWPPNALRTACTLQHSRKRFSAEAHSHASTTDRYPPENIYDVLHFADAQKKRRAEKSGAGNCNCREQYC